MSTLTQMEKVSTLLATFPAMPLTSLLEYIREAPEGVTFEKLVEFVRAKECAHQP